MTSQLDAVRRADEIDRSLLEAKTRIPSQRHDTVTRPALVHRAMSSGGRIVGVTAPAGYGKTTFLTEWAHEDARRIAWVSLDSFDDDPTRLLGLLARAYGCIDPEIETLACELVGPSTSPLGRDAPRFAALLAASPSPFVLMLDDVHELRSDMCQDVLGVIIDGIPPGSQLVIASRSEQSHLPRLRVRGDATEIVASDLALDDVEARQLFAARGVAVSSEFATEIAQRTEGWPAGLHLAALIAKSNGESGSISGADPYFADYLYREAMRLQPKHLQRFLWRSAVLHHMCGSLCDAVVGTTGAAEQLVKLEASGLFLVPLDRRRKWFRFHALFREFLLEQLRQHEPLMTTRLHLRAAEWYEANNAPMPAVEHLLETNENDRTARAINRVALSCYQEGGLSTVTRWFSALGEKNIERYPPLAVSVAWEAVLTGDAMRAERWAAFLDGVEFDEVPLSGTASFESARAMLRAAMCRDGPETMLQDATFAVEHEPHWSRWRDAALWLLAKAHLLSGHTDEAHLLFADSLRTSQEAKSHDMAVLNESELGLLATDNGEWDAATNHVRSALDTVRDKRLDDFPTTLLTYVVAARVALHRGDADDARAQLTRAMRARPSATYAFPHVALRARVNVARVYLALGDVSAARHLVREADEILYHRPALGVLVAMVRQLKDDLENQTHAAVGMAPLTPAELQLLPFLQTHLTLAAIAERRFVSRNTVSSQVRSIYRKLGAVSRDEAVERATTLGLLG